MAVAVMHEQVHQRAGQDQQPRQRPEDMGRVLGEQEKAAHHEKTQAHDPHGEAPERLFLGLLLHRRSHSPRAARRKKKM